MSKDQLRKMVREKRRQISSSYRLEAAKKAADNFVQLALFKQHEHFACYLSTTNEFDTTTIIEAIWQSQKKCYLPFIPSSLTSSKIIEQQLFFARYEYGDVLHLNRYGISEPLHTTQQISAFELDVVLMPLLAFDSKGHRLGTGGGFYDRAFAFVKENETHQTKRPFLMGLGYAAQEVSQLPIDAWDVSLNGILTEKEFILISLPYTKT